MDHFEDIVPENRWKNELLREAEETNRLLSAILETLRKEGVDNADTISENVPVKGTGKRQQGQRVGNRSGSGRG